MKKNRLLALFLSLALVVIAVMGNVTYAAADTENSAKATGVSYYVDSEMEMTLMTVPVKKQPGRVLKKLMRQHLNLAIS